MKRQYWMILILIIILGLTLGMLLFFRREKDEQVLINRAMAAKMAVLAQKGTEGLKKASETDEGQPWYTYYIEEAVKSCGMDGSGDDFGAMDL
ncbi:MAG: hypothetical protein KHX56_13370, partial [Clostridiales bacterium]|nr:hypothetical protein [Clostridiales bacterium]